MIMNKCLSLKWVKWAAAFFITVISASVFAQSQGALTAVQVAPGSKTVSFVVTGTGDESESWCGVRLDYGDGNGIDIKVEKSEPFPKRLQYTYPASGSYVATVVGKRVTTHPPCVISAQTKVSLDVSVNASAGGQSNQFSQLQTANCPNQVVVKAANGQNVTFNLQDLILQSGGVAAAREQVAQKIIESLLKALDEKTGVNDRKTARAYAQSLIQVRDQLAACK